MSAKTVFISYRRDAVGKLFARLLNDALTHRGYDVFLDVDSIDAGKWADQILTQVPVRSHFLILLTPGAFDRCVNDDDWVRREFETATRTGRNIVPVREESVNLPDFRKACPPCMEAVFQFQIASARHADFENDVDVLVARYIAPHQAPVAPAASALPISTDCKADISRIIKYAPAELIGRKAETRFLSDAWGKARRRETERPHVLTFVALGGEGKTSLVAKWAAELAHQDWPGCDAAFAWSFYSQGTREQTQASSDSFLKEALTFFGDPVMAGSAQGAFDKGRRLAQLVGERRALLILDGLEPLQYAPGPPMDGKLKDDGIAELLKGLAATNHGLCVVTTRYSIPDLRAYWQTTAPEVKLSRLSKEAGVALLRSLGVKGSQQEFETLVEDVKGHALTLNLLGSYLRDAHGGDIRKRDLVKLEEADTEEQGGHAFHVMDAYVRWFDGDGEKGKRALAVLRLLGLFDRPATADCLNALWNGEAIAGLTEPLNGVSGAQRNMSLNRLEDAKLLTVNRDAAGTLLSLDAHPLLREYFGKQLRENNLDAWRAAHRRLYEHLRATTKEGDQPTLEDLQPLYQAVVHGCQAGMQKEVLYNIYHARIKRRDENYSSRNLGAFGSDLAAVACFFDSPWRQLSPAFTEAERAWMLNEAAFRLRALGRLSESLEPMRGGLEMDPQKDWEETAVSASNLSEVEMALGNVAEAVRDAEQSVTYADRSGDPFMREATRATHADALHQAGRRVEAETRFREAEEVHKEEQPDYPLLYSVQGFQHCDLLLTAAERAVWQLLLNSKFEVRNSRLVDSCRAVCQRAAQTLKWEEGMHGAPLLDFALHHLSRGRAALYLAVLEKSEFRSPRSETEAAVAGLRRSGNMDDLPRGLLTRAWQRFLEGDAHGAQADLDEAWQIAERGPMKLFMADIHLYRARLFHGVKPYPWNKNPDGTERGPKDDLKDARRLIESCGYWRRKEELEDAEEAAKNW